MSATFANFMVANGIGTNRKLRRLPITQRWVYVAGVLALASQSPIRGALLITDDEPVTADDVAAQASVKVTEARAALASFRRYGMLDTDADGVDWVHDWDAINRDPKPSDSPEATRARKRAQRDRERAQRHGCHADVTRDITECHAPEVEGEVKEEELAGCSPVVCGRADASSRTTSPLSIGEDRQELADHIVGVLQRGIDGLTTDEPCKRPTRAAVLAVLGDASWTVAEAAAVEARSVAQSQDRAPNIVALFAQRLQASLREAA